MQGITYWRLLVILGLLCTSSGSAPPAFNTVTKTWRGGEFSDFSFDQHILTRDGDFLYTNCTVYGVGAGDLKLDCDVNVEEPLLRSSFKSQIKKCRITFDAGREERFAFEPQDITLNSIGGDKVLISWSEKLHPASQDRLYTGKVRLLDMARCSFNEFEFPYDNKRKRGDKFDVAAYTQGFDVFTSNASSCAGLEQCRMSFNLKSRMNVTLAPFFTNLSNPTIVPVSSSSPSKGFYVLGFPLNDPKMFGLSHVSASGFERFLINPTSHENNLECSDSYNLFGCCWTTLNKSAECLQLDADLTVRVNKTFQLEGDTGILSAHNLKDGGMLILTSKIEALNVFYANYRVRIGDHISVLGISRNGELAKLYDMPIFDFECNNQASYQLSVSYVEGKNESCFYFACVQGNYESPSSDLSVGKRCYKQT